MCTVSERLRRALAASSLALALSAPAVVIADDTIALLKDVNPGYLGDYVLGSSPREFVKLGDGIYFSAVDGSDWHSHLWRTDGTPEGTTELVSLTPFGDRLFFAADHPHGTELWTSDGNAEVPAGTHQAGISTPAAVARDPAHSRS